MSGRGLFGTGIRTPELGQRNLTPAGLPGSTYVRPQEQQTGGNLKALASALGGLNSALQNYANVQDREQDDPNSRDNKEWIARRQQMSLDDLRNEARMETHDGIRVRQDALELMLGERANDDFRKSWLEFYNTDFDRTSGNAEAEYERMRQEFAEGIPSEVAQGNFYRLTRDHFRSWMEQDMKEKVSYAKEQLNTTIVDSFRNSIDDAVNIHGKSAQDAAQIIFAKSASNRDFLGLSGKEQNDTMFAIAEEYAMRGEEEIARAILEGTRKGADGKTLPSLIDTSGYSVRGLKLLGQAADMRDKKAEEGSLNVRVEVDEKVALGEFTEAEAERYKETNIFSDSELATKVRQSTGVRDKAQSDAAKAKAKHDLKRFSEGQRARVFAEAKEVLGRIGGSALIEDVEIPSPTDPEGTVTLSAKEAQRVAVKMWEEDFDTAEKQRIQGGMDPEQARTLTNAERIAFYAQSGVKNKDWSFMLNGIASVASSNTLLQKGEVPDHLAETANLYRQLKATNSPYLSTLLTDKKSREFLETYDRAVRFRRMPEKEALTHAALETAKPESVKASSILTRSEQNTILEDTLGDLDLDRRSHNVQRLRDMISEKSKNGATHDEIKDEIEEEVLKNAVPINGVLVFAGGDSPPDFPELMEDVLEDRFERIAKRYGLESSDELFIEADASEGIWYVMSKNGGAIIGDPITRRELANMRSIKRREWEEHQRKLAEGDDEARKRSREWLKARVQAERQRIGHWQQLSKKRPGYQDIMSKAVAERLQKRLDERTMGLDLD